MLARVPQQAVRSNDEEELPLVSVGIPTFNRLGMLRRAVESALQQDYPNIQVVISDNASSDETQEWCEALARHDSRVRYVRQPLNLGPTANFAEVFKYAEGGLYCALGDDDWLEPTYVSLCTQVLRQHSDVVVVCGTPRMFECEQYLHQGRKMNLLQASAFRRVVAYMWQVAENVPFHGVIRSPVLSSLPPLADALAGDWLFVARLAFLGKIKTLDETAINKSVAGTTGNWAKVVRTTSLPSFAARIPYLLIVATVFRDVAWASSVYAPAGRAGRLGLALAAAATLVAKFSLWSAAVIAKRVWYRFTTRAFPLRA
jgi:glycosyltransferase involved in cell wall biosynthesis